MHIYRIIIFLVIFSMTRFLQATLQIDIRSTSAILINPENGKVLFSKNASKIMYPASCTKVAFALYAIKFHQHLFQKKLVCSSNALKAMSESQKSKNDFASVPSYVLESDASHFGLKVGEELTFLDLLTATMVVSGDDASNVIAEVMGEGSIEKCVDDVNRFLHSIGCKQTHFTNPHGLHHPNHVSTAEDLALLCQGAMKEPIFREMVKMSCFKRPDTNKQASVYLQQTNRLLIKTSPYYYPHAVGIKTGTHRRAGSCLTAQADKNGRSLIAVILQAEKGGDRYLDAKKLFEAAFQESEIHRTFIPAGSQPFTRQFEGGDESLTTFTKIPLSLSFYPAEEPDMRCQLTWKNLSVPVEKGDAVGELLLYADNKLMQKATLFASNDVKATFFYSIKQQFSPTVSIGIGVACIVCLILFLVRKR